MFEVKWLIYKIFFQKLGMKVQIGALLLVSVVYSYRVKQWEIKIKPLIIEESMVSFFTRHLKYMYVYVNITF